MNSFLKWPGGKRWFVKRYSYIFPSEYNHYIEPFLGSASVFFFLQPQRAILSDTNAELINLYTVMRDHPSALATLMEKHEKEHCKEYYYQTRSLKTGDSTERAARFLYLNRTCYNGMYRVNQKGEFNVPIGTKTKCANDVDRFGKYSTLLQNASLFSRDFETSISYAHHRDLLFIDPPYAVASKAGTFINYNDKLFSWNDQKRLLKSLCDAKHRGAYIIATNSNNAQLNEMYLDHGFFTQAVQRHCVMAADPTKRKFTEELLITSYDISKDIEGGAIGQNRIIK